MADVAMPRLSDSMEEGTILKWLKSDGDEVEEGEELVEIETDKANMTYEADEAGVLKIVAQEGDTLPVGETIAQIGEGGGSGGEDEADSDEDDDTEAKADSDDEDEDDTEAKADSDDEDEDDTEAQADSDDEDEDDTEAKAETDEDDDTEAKADSDDEDEDDAEAKADSDDEDDEDEDAEAKAGDEDDEAKADSGDDGRSKAEDDGAEAGGDGEESEEESSPVATGKEEQDGGGNGRVKASPVARRMARELGVELGALEGSGPGGRIVKADVEAAAGDGAPKQEEKEKAEKPAPPKEKAPSGDGASGRGETTVEDLTRLQQTIARRMAESKATAPEFVITAEVDMGEAVEFRKQLKGAVGEDGIAPSFNDFVVKSAALALREFPRANGAYRDGKFELYSRINVGIAVAGQDALIVPTIFDADRKALGEIARDARGLADKVREGKITPPELSSGTFSVSNLGMFGIKRFVAVINPPQAGILAVGEMTPRPVVRDGEVTVRPVMEITLSCDHRILYGADAAEFLGRIRERLENPLSLAL